MWGGFASRATVRNRRFADASQQEPVRNRLAGCDPAPRNSGRGGAKEYRRALDRSNATRRLWPLTDGHRVAPNYRMRNIDVIVEEQRSPRETTCPHCGGEANWYFLDEAETIVEVMCEDCGRFEMDRAEFERSESDILEPEQRRE
jgi:hypothetical protein